MKDAIQNLVAKATETHDPKAALQFTQAAMNLAIMEKDLAVTLTLEDVVAPEPEPEFPKLMLNHSGDLIYFVATDRGMMICKWNGDTTCFGSTAGNWDANSCTTFTGELSIDF